MIIMLIWLMWGLKANISSEIFGILLLKPQKSTSIIVFTLIEASETTFKPIWNTKTPMHELKAGDQHNLFIRKTSVTKC